MTNIAELLKDAPKGMKLYSPLFGEVEFAEVMDTSYMPIRVIKRGYGLRFDKYGRYMGNEYPDAECLLFPRKDYPTWQGWTPCVEPKFKVDDEVIWTEPRGSEPVEAVKIIKLNDEEQLYMVDMGNRIGHISYDMQDYYKLVPKPHYDIANFKVGMPVLVRETSLNAWQYVLFSHCYIGGDGLTRFNAGLVGFTQCIPYNDDTKHLLGTTDPCGEEYINW